MKYLLIATAIMTMTAPLYASEMPHSKFGGIPVPDDQATTMFGDPATDSDASDTPPIIQYLLMKLTQGGERMDIASFQRGEEDNQRACIEVATQLNEADRDRDWIRMPLFSKAPVFWYCEEGNEVYTW